jgi:hypothetical protein
MQYPLLCWVTLEKKLFKMTVFYDVTMCIWGTGQMIIDKGKSKSRRKPVPDPHVQ